jgi:hypothetical protein
MIKRNLAAAALIAAALTGQVQAEWTGNDLKEMCGDDSLACTMYVIGFNQGLEVPDNINAMYCRPDGVTNGQLRTVIEKYIYDHPEQLHIGGGGVVMIALIEAFPCEGGK